MNEVFALFLSLSLSGAAVALVVFAAGAIFHRQVSRTWRYYMWLIVLLRLVLPFAPQGQSLMDVAVRAVATPPSADISQQQADQSSLLLQNGYAFDLPLSGVEANASQPQDTAPPAEKAAAGWHIILSELWQYAWVIWLGVFLMLMVRSITSYRGFTRFIRAGWTPVNNPDALEALDEVSALHGLKRNLPLYINPLAASPMLVGILRPVIVLPRADMGKKRLRYILAHELVHYKRGDILYKWLAQAVTCLHWFNPIVHLVKREIGIHCEMSCDEQVLARLTGASYREYGDTLLAAARNDGHYGDKVAPATMSEEGKMMKKRLKSIAKPHRRSWLTLALSCTLCVLILTGAAYAGAYTGGTNQPEAGDPPPLATIEPGAGTALPLATIEPVPTPEATLTPGQRLDSFLGEMQGLADSIGGQAREWGDALSDKAKEWEENWDWDEALGRIEDWGWDTLMQLDHGMHSTYQANGRMVIHEGLYADGFILHLKYDSTAVAGADDHMEASALPIVLPEALEAYAKDDTFIKALWSATERFADRKDLPQVKPGNLSLVAVYGPYTEEPDELAARLYQERETDLLYAVLRSGLVSATQKEALLKNAVEDQNVAIVSIILDGNTPEAVVDALLQAAYDHGDIATFSILAQYASGQAKQNLLEQASRDGKTAFMAGIGEEPGEATIDAMLDSMEDTLDIGTIAMIVDHMTPEQALRVATAAYEQEDIAAFSIVVGRLDDAELEAFHERAHKDERITFYVLTDR